jgi:hypothetical protein
MPNSKRYVPRSCKQLKTRKRRYPYLRGVATFSKKLRKQGLSLIGKSKRYVRRLKMNRITRRQSQRQRRQRRQRQRGGQPNPIVPVKYPNGCSFWSGPKGCAKAEAIVKSITEFYNEFIKDPANENQKSVKQWLSTVIDAFINEQPPFNRTGNSPPGALSLKYPSGCTWYSGHKGCTKAEAIVNLLIEQYNEFIKNPNNEEQTRSKQWLSAVLQAFVKDQPPFDGTGAPLGTFTGKLQPLAPRAAPAVSPTLYKRLQVPGEETSTFTAGLQPVQPTGNYRRYQTDDTGLEEDREDLGPAFAPGPRAPGPGPAFAPGPGPGPAVAPGPGPLTPEQFSLSPSPQQRLRVPPNVYVPGRNIPVGLNRYTQNYNRFTGPPSQ